MSTAPSGTSKSAKIKNARSSPFSTITSKDVSTEFSEASVAFMFSFVIPSPTSVRVNTPSFSVTVTTDGLEFVMT